MKAFLHPNRIPAPLFSAFLHDQDPSATFVPPTELVSDRQLPTRLRRTKVDGSISMFKGRIADGEIVWGRERGGKCPKGESATMDRQIDRLIR
jgi:hypothetical protein